MESITCPGCQKPIRLPEEVLGQKAQCPFCKCHFLAPSRTAGGLSEPQLLRRNPFARSPTFAPGLLLLFVGLLGVLTNAINIAKNLSDPIAFAAKTREDFERFAQSGGGDELRAYGERTVTWMPRMHFVFLGLSLLTAVGGVAMLRQRWHGLAMIGSFVALFNVVNCCCVLGFPAGGWALFKLMNPQVRALFRAPSAGGAA